MGTKMAPSYANLFLGYFEAKALENAPFQPHTWFRYIDDIFMIWTEGLDNPKVFIDYLNSIHPTIPMALTYAKKPISFSTFTILLSFLSLAYFKIFYFTLFTYFLYLVLRISGIS